jgi:hypothetical protein
MDAAMKAGQTQGKSETEPTQASFGSKMRSMVAAAEMMVVGATGVGVSSCTHTAELQTYRKDASGKIIEKSEIAGATLHYPGVAGLMAQSDFHFENMYVAQFKAHLEQQSRRLGIDHCVNRWMANCPGLQGASDNLRLVDAHGKVESLFKFLVHEGVEAGKALALMNGLMNIPADNINIKQRQSQRQSQSVPAQETKPIGDVIPGTETYF